MSMPHWPPCEPRSLDTWSGSSSRESITCRQPAAADPLPWSLFAEVDVAYFTAGDAAALAEARRAKTLVATSRAIDIVEASGVSVDAIVGSERDPAERFDATHLAHPPGIAVFTSGARGGRFTPEGGHEATYEPAPLP